MTKRLFCFCFCLLGGFAKADTDLRLNPICPQNTIEHLDHLDDVRHRVARLIELSDRCRVTREELKAKDYAEQAVELARQISTDNSLILAQALNAFGNVLMNSQHFKNYEQAFKCYQEALQLFVSSEQPQLSAHILTNLAQLWIDVKPYSGDTQKTRFYQDDEAILLQKAIHALDTAFAATWLLPEDNQDKAFNLIHLSQIARQIQTELAPDNKQLMLKAYHALEKLRRFDAKAFPRVVSYAYGYLGELYQSESRYSDALRLTRQAIFYAQTVLATDILSLWERQLGQLLNQLGDQEGAIKAYERAVIYLNDIRSDLEQTSYRSRQLPFRETAAGQVYLELIALLLKEAKNSQEKKKQAFLCQAQDIIEQFKTFELENYFQDDCVGDNSVVNNQDKPAHPCALKNHQPVSLINNKAIRNTAVLYPIIFPERLELLLRTDNQRQVVTMPVNQKRLEEELIKKLIIELNEEKPTWAQVPDLLPHAQQLYNELIRPFESELLEVETLIVIPDGALRRIPFAVLHDGKRYLIEKHYALATTPSLSLTDTPEKWMPNQPILLNGLSIGQNPLPYVKTEVEAIGRLSQSEKLLDKAFTRQNFLRKIKEQPYQVIHIATHGTFQGNPKESFLEAYNSRLTLDDLEQVARWGRFRERPVALLTLSACESAMGNDEAALGLSGLAVKAGTISALASLWQVNDLSTCYLMEAFYHELKAQPVMAKAHALQQAQRLMLKGELNQKTSVCGKLPDNHDNFKHPHYWGAFLLIGYWL